MAESSVVDVVPTFTPVITLLLNDATFSSLITYLFFNCFGRIIGNLYVSFLLKYNLLIKLLSVKSKSVNNVCLLKSILLILLAPKPKSIKAVFLLKSILLILLAPKYKISKDVFLFKSILLRLL